MATILTFSNQQILSINGFDNLRASQEWMNKPSNIFEKNMKMILIPSAGGVSFSLGMHEQEPLMMVVEDFPSSAYSHKPHTRIKQILHITESDFIAAEKSKLSYHHVRDYPNCMDAQPVGLLVGSETNTSPCGHIYRSERFMYVKQFLPDKDHRKYMEYLLSKM